MANTVLLQYTCTNAECKHTFKMRHPGKGGYFTVKVPELPADGTATQPNADGAAATGAAAGINVGVRKVPADQAIPGTGVAGQSAAGQAQQQAHTATRQIDITDDVQPFRGMLRQLRPLWKSIDHQLHEGSNIIGRKDPAQPCDIMIDKDPSMSRRSVAITVSYTQKGYTFRLKVLNATNPVMHRGLPLTVGEEVYLNFGDELVLGKTKFRFLKVE